MDAIATPQPSYEALPVDIGVSERHRAQLAEGLLAEETRGANPQP